MTTKVILALMLGGLAVFGQHDSTQLTNQYGVIIDRHPLEPEFRNGILTFETKNKDYKIWLDNRVYIDGAFFFVKHTYSIGNGIAIRRARMDFKTIIKKNWHGEIDLDFAGSQTEMKDMIVGYTSPAKRGFMKHISIKVGNFKEGFSMKETTSSRYIQVN